MVARQIIHPVGRHLPQFFDLEIMNQDLLGILLGSPVFPRILEITHQFLFLGVNRNNGLPVALLTACLAIDVLELSIPVRSWRPVN